MSQSNDIEVRFTGDTSDLLRSAENVRKEISALRKETAQISVEQAQKAFNLAQATATKAGATLDKARQNVQKQKDLLKQAESELAEAQKKLETTQKSVSTKYTDSSPDVTNNKNVQRAYRNVQKNDSSVTKAQNALNTAKINEEQAKLALEQASANILKKEQSLEKAKSALEKAESRLNKATTQKATESARTAIEKAEERITKAEQSVQKAILAEKKAAQALTNAQSRVVERQTNVTTANTNLEDSRKQVAYSIAQAKSQAGSDEVAAAQQVVDNAQKKMESAKKAVESAVSAEEKATQKLNSAQTSAKSAQIKLNTAEANSKLRDIKNNIQSVQGMHRIDMQASTQSAKAKLDKLNDQVTKLQQTAANIRIPSISSFATTAAAISATFYDIQHVVGFVGTAFNSLIGTGLTFQKQMETARIGIAGIYASMTEIDGKRTSFEQGMGIANEVVQKLNRAAAITAATPADLLTTFQGIAAPGLGAGMSTDELVKFTTVGVNAAKAMNLPSTQYIQELRDLVQGGIQPASSTIATALGLKDSDIKAMKESADGLFKSLMDKMQGMAEGANSYTETLEGKQELLKQSFLLTSASISSSFEVEMKSALDSITSMFAEVDTQAGTFELNPAIQDFIKELKLDMYEVMEMFGSFDSDTGAWTPSDTTLTAWEEMRNFLSEIKTVALDLSNLFVAWSPAINDVVLGIKDGLENITVFLDKVINIVESMGIVVSKSEDGLKVFRKIAEVLTDIVGLVIAYRTTLVIIHGVLKAINIVVGVWKGLEKGIVKLKAMQLALTSAARAGIAGIVALGAGGVALLTGALDGVFETIGNQMDGLLDTAVDKDELSSIADTRKSSFGQDTTKDEDAYNKATSREKNKKDETANKERLKAVQNGLSKILKHIDNALKEQLDLQKEHMENVELLNKQGKISIDEYYAEKANNDKVVAEANLSALQQKKEAIVSVKWPEDKLSERDSKLEQINAEMAKQSHALEKAADNISGLKEIKKIWEDSFVRNNSTRSEAEIASGKSEKDLIQGLTEFAVKNGWDDPATYVKQIVESSKKYGVDSRQVAAIIQQESGGRQSAISPVGAIGLGQLMPSTAEGVGVNAYDALQNIEGTAKYIAEMMQRNNGEYDLANASYNAGYGAVLKYDGVPPYKETQNYVASVKALFNALSNLPDSRELLQKSQVYGFNAEGSSRLEGSNFDSRFFNKSESALGATRLDNVKTIVSQTMNGLAEQLISEFPELGKLIITGAGESGWGHSSSPNGHSSGWKLDIGMNGLSSTIISRLVELADKLGIAVGNEGNHLDLSFGAGGVGGTQLTNNATGKLHNVKTLENYTARTNLNNDYREALIKEQEYLKQLEYDVKNRTGEGAAIKIEQIQNKYNKEIAKQRIEYPSGYGEKAANYLEQKRDLEVADVKFADTKTKLEQSLKDLETSGKAMGEKIVDGVVSLSEGFDRYYNHFNGDNSPIKKQASALEGLMREYESKGDLDMYWKVRSQIEETKKSFDNIVSSWLSQIEEGIGWQQDMVNANWTYSSGQKERINESYDLLKHQNKASVSAKKIEHIAKELEKKLEEMRKVTEELVTATDETAKQKLEDEKEKISAEIKGLEGSKQKELQTYELETRLSHIKTLLEETRETAKNALEDGLVNFLSDGIQEAENLGEALSNLAYNFLKTMNQYFSKKVVANFMDNVLPGESIIGEETGFGESETLGISLGQSTAATQQATTVLGLNTTALQALTTAVNNMAVSGSTLSLNNTGFATGGYISGAGTSTSDSIPAMLSNGEYVIKADSVRRYGRSMLDRINSGAYERLKVHVPKFATGGYVGSTGARATDSFATSFGASVSPHLHVNNYVDGKKVFDSYGKDVVRSEVTKAIVQNAKLYSKTLGRF